MNAPIVGWRRAACIVLLTLVVMTPVLVALAQPAAARAVALSRVSGTVAARDGLNLRTGPGTTYKVVRTLANGAGLAISDTSGDWFKVTSGGSSGWVNSWYVVLSGTPSKAITRGNPARKMIALTFDAGSDLGHTEWIISTLEAHRVTASFGLTGAWIQAHPEYAAWIVADGFQVLNHTLDHPSFTGLSTGAGTLSPARRLAQIAGNERLLRDLAGGSAKPYWRPPYGDIDASVLRDAGAAGYGQTIMWTVDSMGWNGYSADQIVNRVVTNAGYGGIVLMHVGSASQDAAALERIIHWYRDRGYTFGTVAQVIAP